MMNASLLNASIISSMKSDTKKPSSGSSSFNLLKKMRKFGGKVRKAMKKIASKVGYKGSNGPSPAVLCTVAMSAEALGEAPMERLPNSNMMAACDAAFQWCMDMDVEGYLAYEPSWEALNGLEVENYLVYEPYWEALSGLDPEGYVAYETHWEALVRLDIEGYLAYEPYWEALSGLDVEALVTFNESLRKLRKRLGRHENDMAAVNAGYHVKREIFEIRGSRRVFAVTIGRSVDTGDFRHMTVAQVAAASALNAKCMLAKSQIIVRSATGRIFQVSNSNTHTFN